MELENFTDNFIDNFFSENNIDDENFFNKLEAKIKAGQTKLKSEVEMLMKENEYNAKTMNETKDSYFEKLDQITHLHNNYEYRVDLLNKHYSEKLAYISILSNKLSDFEKFTSNISYANKIFDLIALLNESEDINKVMPDIFINNEKMLDEGIEIYEAFRQLIDVTQTLYPNFNKNFKVIETKMKQCIQDSIKEFYESNDLDKLEKLLKVTEVLNSDFIIEFYVEYILDSMGLNSIINSVKNMSYDKMSNELYSHLFKIIDEFHENIIKTGNLQYGYESSKIYLLFPEVKQKLVIGSLVKQISKKLNEFRTILVTERGKADEVYVKIIEYIYPKSLQFIKDFKDNLKFTKTDLWNTIDQDTTLFLRGIEAVYMNKERNILNNFISFFFDSKLKKVSEIKRNYENKLITIEQFQNDTLSLIQETSLSILVEHTTTTIKRYHTLIGNKDERVDLTESYCKSILDSIKGVIESYYNLVKMLLTEREKLNCLLSEQQYYILYKLNFILNDFSQIFLNELKDFFRSIKFYDELEDSVKRRVDQIKFNLDQLFSQLLSYTSGTLNQMLKLIKYKETYVVKSSLEVYSVEIDKVLNFLRPLFTTVTSILKKFFFFIFRWSKTGRNSTKRECFN